MKSRKNSRRNFLRTLVGAVTLVLSPVTFLSTSHKQSKKYSKIQLAEGSEYVIVNGWVLTKKDLLL